MKQAFTAILLLLHVLCLGQDSLSFFQPSSKFQKKRLALLGGGEIAVIGGSLTFLNATWYQNYPRSSFHWFNDNDEWMQMDKVAHGFDTYFIGKLGYSGFKWCGMAERKAAIFGGGIGFLYLAGIEILDGYSAAWGASKGDIIANTAGTALFITQQLVWEEQRVALKISSRPTKFAPYRPEVLGSNAAERLLKDYNGMTIWLCVNPASFSKEESWMPKWIDIALGYGANGMTGGSANVSINEAGQYVPQFRRSRQIHLSLDLRLDKIPVKSKFLHAVFSTFSFVKLPFPALIYTDGVGLAMDPLGY